MATMGDLPIDTSHPAVRDYLALTRLQVLTPLSLVVSIASLIVCSMVVEPSIGGISRLRPTSISPSVPVIGLYVLMIYLTQVGYCVLLVLAKKPETKRAMVKAVGLPLVFSNYAMAIWAIAWVMQWFLFATILQGILLLLLLYSNVTLLVYHPLDPSRPLDTALIHAPLRFFFVLPFMLLFPLCLFITLGLTYHPTPPGPPSNYADWHSWTAVGIIVGTNIVGAIAVLLRRDIVWTIAATWINVSIWTSKPKPAAVYITVIIFTVLHPLALLTSEIYHRFYKPRRQAVALEGGDEHPGLYRHQNGQHGRVDGEGTPREVNENEIWS